VQAGGGAMGEEGCQAASVQAGGGAMGEEGCQAASVQAGGRTMGEGGAKGLRAFNSRSGVVTLVISPVAAQHNYHNGCGSRLP